MSDLLRGLLNFTRHKMGSGNPHMFQQLAMPVMSKQWGVEGDVIISKFESLERHVWCLHQVHQREFTVSGSGQEEPAPPTTWQVKKNGIIVLFMSNYLLCSCG